MRFLRLLVLFLFLFLFIYFSLFFLNSSISTHHCTHDRWSTLFGGRLLCVHNFVMYKKKKEKEKKTEGRRRWTDPFSPLKLFSPSHRRGRVETKRRQNCWETGRKEMDRNEICNLPFRHRSLSLSLSLPLHLSALYYVAASFFCSNVFFFFLDSRSRRVHASFVCFRCRQDHVCARSCASLPVCLCFFSLVVTCFFSLSLSICLSLSLSYSLILFLLENEKKRKEKKRKR